MQTGSSAKALAAASIQRLTLADQRFGKFFIPFRGNVPRGFILGHAVKVNPMLRLYPTAGKDTAGYLQASVTIATDAGMRLTEMQDPVKCSYAWCRNLNVEGMNVIALYSQYFTVPDHDFWFTAYLKYSLGDAVFLELWNLASKTAGAIADSLMHVMETSTRKMFGKTVPQLTKQAQDCRYVSELAKLRGMGISEGFGVYPYLDPSKITHLFYEK